MAEQAAENGVEGEESLLQALEARRIFRRRNGTSQLVPFPTLPSEFPRSL
jgi:hypothetical protein